MVGVVSGRTSVRDRIAARWDALRTSFGFLSLVLMVAGAALGFGVPAIDRWLDVELPLFEFSTQDAARSLLATIATVTVAVAGLSFSVTIVAFTLSSSQLSPRVLRTFRADRMSQWTLALLLGTFLYCISVLVRLGVAENDARVPNLSITLAVVLAFASFALFAAFIAHIVNMLQPSSVIALIADDARNLLGRRFPEGVGRPPRDADVARRAIAPVLERPARRSVRSEGEGYITQVDGDALLAAAGRHDALVRQTASVGQYVVSGQVVAEIWSDAEDLGPAADAVRSAFRLGSQRTGVQDVAFPVRQLADIALKGLSPGINDPTTAENAMEAMTGVLVRLARRGDPCELRADDRDVVRLVARVATLDDLVRLGFDQVRVFAAPYPVVSVRLLELLGEIADAARASGTPHEETAEQARLVRDAPAGEVPTEADAERVRSAYARVHTPPVL